MKLLTRLSSDSSESFPTSNMVTAWVFKPGDKFPIMRYAVRVESKRNPIFRLPVWEVRKLPPLLVWKKFDHI